MAFITNIRDSRRCFALAAIVLLAFRCGRPTRELRISRPEHLPAQMTWVNLQGGIQDVAFVDERTGWAVGADGLILKTEDGGEHWVYRPSVRQRRMLSHIRFFDQQTGVIAGYNEYNQYIFVLRTTDGGEHWQEVAFPGRMSGAADLTIHGRSGWISTGSNALYVTADAGQSWSALTTPAAVDTFALGSEMAGWAAGGQHNFLHTNDGGRTWSLQFAADRPVFALFALDERTVWAGLSDRVLRSTDGGAHWETVPLPDSAISHFHFVDSANGWAVGNGVFRTADGGRTWSKIYAAADSYLSVHSCWTFDGKRGVITGENGLLLKTTDGIQWTEHNKSPPLEELAHGEPIVRSIQSKTVENVQFQQLESNSNVHNLRVLRVPTDPNFVWAAASVYGDVSWNISVFLTTDGGAHWRPFRIGREAGLKDLALIGRDKVVVYLTDPLSTIIGTPSNYAPWVDRFVMRETLDGVVLEWHVRDDEGDAVKSTGIEFSPKTKTNFGPVHAKIEEVSPGTFRAAWSPDLDPGTKIFFRIAVQDANKNEFIQQLPKPAVYQSWWNRQPQWVQATLLALAAIAVYWLLCALLLWLAPLQFLRIESRLPRGLLDPVGLPAPVKAAFAIATMLFGIEFFTSRDRVARRWLALFENDVAGLDDLAPPTRTKYLRRADVRAAWIRHYREGRVAIGSLPAEVRALYINDTALLDALVARRIDLAAEAFSQMAFVQQRNVYIRLPLRVTDRGTESLVTSPEPAHFAPLFARERTIVEIIGEGGAGKSTLAVFIASILMSDDSLLGHRAIPLLIQEEVSDAFAQICGILRELMGGEDMEADVVTALLEQKRIVAIFDALSERSDATRAAVATVHRTLDLNAILVTSRQPLEFGGVPVARIEPQLLGIDTVVYFVTEYLAKKGSASLFPRRDPLQLADRILALMERREEAQSVTPLFVTIFVDEACDLRARNADLGELPSSIPEIVLSHLRRTNPQDSKTPNFISNEQLIAYAKQLGRASVGERFVPGDFLRPPSMPSNILDRFVSNGILVCRERAGVKIYRFSLDPFAEYLAALDQIDALRGNELAWTRWLEELEQMGVGSIRGFLMALSNVVAAYEHDFRIPAAVGRKLDQLLAATIIAVENAAS